MNDLVRTEALQDCHWEYVCRTQGDCINTLVRTVSNDYLERKEGRKEGMEKVCGVAAGGERKRKGKKESSLQMASGAKFSLL